MVVVGDTAVGAEDKLGRLAAVSIAVDERAPGIWSPEAEDRSSRSPKAATDASRVEVGAEMVSEAELLEAGAVGAMDAGAETDETGGEVAE